MRKHWSATRNNCQCIVCSKVSTKVHTCYVSITIGINDTFPTFFKTCVRCRDKSETLVEVALRIVCCTEGACCWNSLAISPCCIESRVEVEDWSPRQSLFQYSNHRVVGRDCRACYGNIETTERVSCYETNVACYINRSNNILLVAFKKLKSLLIVLSTTIEIAHLSLIGVRIVACAYYHIIDMATIGRLNLYWSVVVNVWGIVRNIVYHLVEELRNLLAFYRSKSFAINDNIDTTSLSILVALYTNA